MTCANLSAPSRAMDAKPCGTDAALRAAAALHDAGRYGEAAAMLDKIAASGNREAQERLGLMFHYGELLYGRDFPCDPERAAHWLGKAAAQGSDFARSVLRHGRVVED